MKAVIRGITISYTARRNKEKYAQQNKLQQRIKELETQLQSTPKDLRLQNQMTVTKHKLKLIEQEGMITYLNTTRQIYFEQANKPRRWQSYTLKKEKKKRLIYQLIGGNGDTQHRIEQKKEIVHKYFEDLYKKEEVNEDRIRNYLGETKDKVTGEEMK
uniref:Uncharacterized protein n=1 Tax=Micrurus lemniscatus lemniscatus TaxID=129467 RepID=A0A2D4JH72_MICLE